MTESTRTHTRKELMKLARELLLVDSNNVSLLPGYFDIIDNGLPNAGEQNSEIRVLIIGAGIAGLVAGSLLKAAGFDIRVIEANGDRIGGRVKTFRPIPGRKAPFSDPEQYAEAGAMRIPEPAKHPLVHKYLTRLGLDSKKREFYNVDVDVSRPGDKVFRTWLKTNGRSVRKADYYGPPEAPDLGFPLGSNSGANTSKLLSEAIQTLVQSVDVTSETKKVIENPDRYRDTPLDVQSQLDCWVNIIKKYGDFSMRRFLKEKCGHPEGVIDAIGTLENLTSRMPYSFIQSFIESTYINSETVYYELDGGSWQIPYAFLESGMLDEGDLVMNRRVVEINWTSDSQAEFGRLKTVSEPVKNRDLEPGRHAVEEEDFTGNRIICTIPFTALRHVKIEPLLSYEKRRAIFELHYDSATKILLEFSERFWEWDEATWASKLGGEYRGHNSYGGGSVTDNPNRFIYFPGHRVEGSEGGVVLASYSWADDARRWDSLAEQDRYDYALQGLVDIYGPGIKNYYTGSGQTVSWLQNHYAQGEAAIFYPGQLEYLHPHIPGAEGNLHFAGEHTSLKHAWIEGAIESGIRAALEVSRAANRAAGPISKPS